MMPNNFFDCSKVVDKSKPKHLRISGIGIVAVVSILYTVVVAVSVIYWMRRN